MEWQSRLLSKEKISEKVGYSNMSMIEHQLISKVLEEKSFFILNKYNVSATDFIAIPEVYGFVKDYVDEYKETPDFRTVVAECENFNFQPEVHDTFPYLCKVLKSNSAKRSAFELLQKEATANFSKMNGSDFVDWLATESNKIKEVTSVHTSMGTNFATNGAERWQKYLDSKEKRTNMFIPTPYPTLTEALGGGCELGDYVLFMAYTNRGKSWVGSDFGIHAWNNGFGVLHYSPELSKVQQEQRLDTLNGHFNNMNLKLGELANEKAYQNYLNNFTEKNETPYIIKTMEDLPQGLSLEVIEADLQMNPNIKMVIIDGFNLMTHRGRGQNRENMSNTSRQLRQLFGRHEVLGLVIHQTPTSAEKENKEKDETGTRIVKPPELDQYSETVAVIQDSSLVLTFDQHDGMGKIKVAKTRTTCVGLEIDLHCDFNNGYIKEATVVDYI